MGRNRFREKQKPKSHHHQGPTKTNAANIKRRQHSQIKQPLLVTGSRSGSKRKSVLKSQLAPRIPFLKSDRVLLVGEGDFSFALSLVKNYDVAAVVATSYDDEQTLHNKYPSIHKTIELLQSHAQSSRGLSESQSNSEWNGFSADEDEHSDSCDELDNPKTSVLHEIDATKLSSAYKKILSQYAPFTKIVFNFPHTGGLSTDVNRQVRANQELLVSFFNAAKPLLLSQSHNATSHSTQQHGPDGSDGEEGNHMQSSTDLTSGRGCILVTLFEREPYTLWNIRDLARHCGLEVIESFKFPWPAYPGYQHARTVGDITTGRDRSEEGKRKGAWRGEERDARCYVFGFKTKVSHDGSQSRNGRRAGSSDDDSD